MSSGSPPHGEGDHGSTATDRSSGQLSEPFSQGFASRGDSSSTARARRVRSSTARRWLGPGWVDVPPGRDRDPADAVLPDPVVPEEERFCRVCRAGIGRGRPGAVTGFCPQCGSAFSFVPRLRPREVISDRYEVVGVLMLSSMGATYLAQDHAASDRWVVLRELADTAVDRRFLAELDHPNIAKAYDFASHPDAGTSFGYLVTEYVGGESLWELALASQLAGKQVPIIQVLIYGLEILSAVGYLHSQGLLHSDLNPDNVIHRHHQLKLVGLDAVRRMDDTGPALSITRYSAPELATHGPSVASDLYAVGRTLAELSLKTASRADAHQSSYARFLRRATHEDPGRRFGSAGEMADQLAGVLREIVALGTGESRSGTSTLFGPPVRAFGTTVVLDTGRPAPAPEAAEVVAALPNPLVDPEDPAADVLSAITPADPAELIAALDGTHHESIEALLRLVRICLELAEPLEAQLALWEARRLASRTGRPHDWRLEWYRGLLDLDRGPPFESREGFAAVLDELPGELAPKLAFAVDAEMVGSYEAAERSYDAVWRTDHAYVSAAFGLARLRLAKRDRVGTISVLDSVPATSPEYTAAQVAVIKIRISGKPSADDLVDAAWRLAVLPIVATERLRLSIAVLEAAYRWVRSAGGRPESQVLGWALTERDLRTGLKECRRALARQSAGIEPRAPGSRWHVFVDGLAESLALVPRRRRRPRRSGWERIEARLHERYRELGPPEAAGYRETGKDGHR